MPKSKRPKGNARSPSIEVEERIIALRKALDDRGADGGAHTIWWHLSSQGLEVPSPSTIYRILERRGFITREPSKRPKASYVRFEASLPNECWQSDMTHYQLADGTGVEILNFIDDYSRLVLGCECYGTVKAPDVCKMFLRCAETFELPASVLTDNGAIYNARSRGGRTGFESDLAERGVLYKHSTAYHPQTCGKVERWHRTLKGFLSKRPATSLLKLQQVLDEIVAYYNDVRPHQARARVTPRAAYEGRAKMPRDTLINQPHYRIRRDTVDQRGHVTLRYLGSSASGGVGCATSDAGRPSGKS